MNWHRNPVKRLGALLMAAVLVSGFSAACGRAGEQGAQEETALPGGEAQQEGDRLPEENTEQTEKTLTEEQSEEGEKALPEGQEQQADRAESEEEKGKEGGRENGTPYRFTDDLGREVSVDSWERVAVLLGSYADMWVLAGGDVCAAPVDAFEDFDLPLSEETVNLGETKRLSLEQLLASSPDFVLASTNTPQHLEWQQALEGAGITVAYFDVACFEDYLRMLKICTDITGKPERYEQYGLDIKDKIEEILERNAGAEPLTVLVMRASATSIRAKNSEGNVLGEMVESFGCVNIADTDESLLENLSIESIMLQNPDRIFIAQSGDDTEGTKQNIENMFQENPLWKELDAVKNGHVHLLDKHLYNLKPNARWAEAYEQLEDMLYGE